MALSRPEGSDLEEVPPLHPLQAAPFVLLGGLVGITYLIYPVRPRDLWVSYFVYFVPPFGKESVVPSLVTLGFDPLFVAAAVAVLDVAGALLVFTNWHLIVRIPVIGPWMQRFGERLTEMAERRVALKGAGGVFLFFWVMFPLQGSGGVSAALISRVMGMPMAVALGVIATAAFSSALFIGTATSSVLRFLPPIYVLVAVAAVVGLVGLRYLVALRGRDEEE